MSIKQYVEYYSSQEKCLCGKRNCQEKEIHEQEFYLTVIEKKSYIIHSQKDENSVFDFDWPEYAIVYPLLPLFFKDEKGHYTIKLANCDPELWWEQNAAPYCGCANCHGLAEMDYWNLELKNEPGEKYVCWVWFCQECLYLDISVYKQWW